MDSIKKNPETLYQYYNYILRDYNYSFLNELTYYNITIESFYHYLNCNDIFKLKNIWNYILSKWFEMHHSLKDNNKYKKSIYYQKKHEYIHSIINEEQFDQLLCDFIQKDSMLGIFVMNSILAYALP